MATSSKFAVRVFISDTATRFDQGSSKVGVVSGRLTLDETSASKLKMNKLGDSSLGQSLGYALNGASIDSQNPTGGKRAILERLFARADSHGTRHLSVALASKSSRGPIGDLPHI
jgi:hypothetical protein